jgi:hypothetical protein
MKYVNILSVVFVTIIALGNFAFTAAQELETETARLPHANAIEAGAGYEHQISSEGSEIATPLFAEIGLLDRLELIVEPVAYTAIVPKQGIKARGIGDLELTFIGLGFKERPVMPAVAFAAELKIPTAKNDLIGTRKYDYTGYVIVSKQTGKFDSHLNVGYSIIGKPAGVQVNNIFTFAAATRYLLNDKIDLFAELFGNTSATPEAEGEGKAVSGVNAELTGNALVGALGVSYHITPYIHFALGMSYDNNNAFMIHPGFSLLCNIF